MLFIRNLNRIAPQNFTETRRIQTGWSRKKQKIRRQSKKIQIHGKTRKYEEMRRTYVYASMTEDTGQCSRGTFYEVV